MDKYIKTETVIGLMRKYAIPGFMNQYVDQALKSFERIRTEIEALPAEDVRPNRRGRVVTKRRMRTGGGAEEQFCSRCRRILNGDWLRYCDYCGADLRGAKR